MHPFPRAACKRPRLRAESSKRALARVYQVLICVHLQLANMTNSGRFTAGGAFALTSLLSRALAQGTCGEVVWEQKFESPTIDELLQEADGEAFYPVGDPPGCVLAVCNLLCMKLKVQLR